MINSIKINHNSISMHAQSPHEVMKWKNLFASLHDQSTIDTMLGNEVVIAYPQNPHDKNDNIILQKKHSVFTYEEIEQIILQMSTKSQMVDSSLTMNALQQAKENLPATDSLFITEDNPIFSISIKNENLMLSPISVEFGSTNSKAYTNFIRELKSNIHQYKTARLFVEKTHIINVSDLQNSQDTSDIIMKQFMKYGLNKKSEKDYVHEFIVASVIKNIALKEIQVLQDLVDMPNNHPIKKHKECLKVAYSIFLRLSKNGAINALNEVQMKHLKEAAQLIGIFKYAPPAIILSFEKLLAKIPQKMANHIKTGRKNNIHYN